MNTRAALRGLLLASTTLAWPLTAAAQTSAQDPSTQTATSVGEVIVTAQKRSQNQQDVPLSIQTLSSKSLDQLQVQKFEDYIKFLPSVSVSGAAPGFNATVVVRGVASDGGNIASGSLPIVGQYLDEQPITTIDGAPDIHTYDIARVESLAGPQGTLFGASSMGGVLRVITNKPDYTKFSAGYDLEANTFTKGGPGGQVEGFVNEPISDRAALRVVGWYSHQGGFIDNEAETRTYQSTGVVTNNAPYVEKNYNHYDVAGGRAALALKLNDDWTITPSIIGQYGYRNGNYAFQPAKGDLVVGAFTKEYGRDEWYQAALTINGKIGDFDVLYSGAYMSRATDQDFDYSQYSFYYDQLYGQNPGVVNNSGGPADPNQYLHNLEHFTKLSQEARISTPTSWRIHGLAGVFYQRQFQDIELDYINSDLSTVPTPDGDGGFNPPQSVSTRPGDSFLTREHRVDEDFALFSQLDFDVTSKLTLTAGGRYYRYDNSLSGFFGTSASEAACIGPANVPGGPCANIGTLNSDGSVAPREVKGDGFTYRFGVNYKLTPNNLLYATVSDGFRPGGTNRLGSRSVGVTGATVPYTPDYLTNYEIGSKNTFWNKRATLNVTAFDEEWKDIQLTFLIKGVGLIQNAGKARSRGVEISGSVVPMRGLTITSAATYTDAYLANAYSYGTTVTASKGVTLPFSPALKTNLIARYVWDWRDVTLHAQAAQTYQSSSWSGFSDYDRYLNGRRNAYGNTDLSFGGERNSKTFEFYVTNLFDRRGITYKIPNCYYAPGTCNEYYYTTQPRLIGVRFGQRF